MDNADRLRKLQEKAGRQACPKNRNLDMVLAKPRTDQITLQSPRKTK
jgi:hypothetical protein